MRHIWQNSFLYALVTFRDICVPHVFHFRFNEKPEFSYANNHFKDKTVVWQSYLFEMEFLYCYHSIIWTALSGFVAWTGKCWNIYIYIHTYKHTYLLLLISMLWHRQAIFKSKGNKLCSSAEFRIWTRGPRHQIASRLNACWQTNWAIEDQAKKTWTRQPVPMISEHSAHLTPPSVDFRTWLWQYTYLLLLISMLWHRQAIFKLKGDKLCSSAECRIWTQGPRQQIASRLNARWQTDWAIEDQAKILELDSPSLWSASIQPTWPHCQLTFAPGSDDIHICCC